MDQVKSGLIIAACSLLFTSVFCYGGPVVRAEELAGKSVAEKCHLLAVRGNWLQAPILCKEAAGQGDLGAMLILEQINGSNRPLYPQALALAKGGSSDAAGYLGAALLVGQVPDDVAAREDALHWLQVAADGGGLGAHYWLGVAYYSGAFAGIEANLELAGRYLQWAADRGHKESSRLLAELHLYRQLGQPADALPLLRQADPEPRGSNWGWVYEHGIGVPVDLTKAEALYRQSPDLLGIFRALQLVRQRPHTIDELKVATQLLETHAIFDEPAPWQTAKPAPNGDSCRLLAGLFASGQVLPTRSTDVAAEVARWYGYAAFYDRQRPRIAARPAGGG